MNFKQILYFVCLTLVMSLSLPEFLFAQVPQQLPYQGVLTDSSNAPLDGSFNLTFRIYNVSTGGVPLWSEIQNNVSISDGLFNVLLGSVTALTLDFSQTYWLSIQVNSDGEMFPRQQLAAVPYARRSQSVELGTVPIGSIMAWHKSFPDTPPLPSGWVECNGQILNDTESVYHGQVIPNINGEARFLRGSSVSGVLQEATRIPGPAEIGFGNEVYVGNNEQNTSISLLDADEEFNDGQSGRASWNTNQMTSDSRPDAFRVRVKNMSIVWIIRVK